MIDLQEVDRLDKERTIQFKQTMEYIDDLLRNNVALVKTEPKENQRNPDSITEETAPWYVLHFF